MQPTGTTSSVRHKAYTFTQKQKHALEIFLSLTIIQNRKIMCRKTLISFEKVFEIGIHLRHCLQLIQTIMGLRDQCMFQGAHFPAWCSRQA